MLNVALIAGRLVRDPEMRRTGTGIAVTSFTLAVEDDYKGSDGEKHTIFVDVVAWRHTAEFVSKYFSKGRMAIVKGKFDVRNFVDKEGNKRKNAEIVAENVYFGDSKRDDNHVASYDSAPGGFGSYAENPGYPVQYGGEFDELEDYDAQLPF